MIRRLAAATVAFAAIAAIATAADPGSGDEGALRQRAADLFEKRERARTEGGISLEDLARDLGGIARELRAAGLDSLAAQAHHRAGGVLVRLNRAEEARAELEVAVAAARRAGDVRRELGVRSYLADILVDNDPNAALDTVRALIPKFRALRDETELGAARSTEARAWMALGRAREALAASRRAVRHYRKADRPSQEAFALGQAAQALRFLDRHVEALALADSILALGERAEIGRSMARGWLERASCLRTLGREEEGLVAADRALEVDRRLGDVRHQAMVRAFRLPLLLETDRFAQCRAEADSLLAETDPRNLNLRLTAALHGVAAAMAMGEAAGAEERLLPEIEAYEEFRRSLPREEDHASTAEHGSSVYAVLARALLAQGRAEDAWRAAERGRAFALKRRLDAPDVPDLEPVLRDLRESRAALLHFEGTSARFGTVFVLADGRVAAAPLRHDVRSADVDLATELLASGAARARDDPALHRLADALLGDALPLVPADVTRLVVVAPVAAPALPLEALPADGGTRLGDRWAVSYAPSAAVLGALEGRRTPGDGLLALADPAVQARDASLAALDEGMRGRIARSLPAARREAQQLKRRGATALLGRQATLERLRSAPRPSVLHFATHALEHPRLAPRGGLVLAGDPPLLTAAAVESLAVSADLVSLSACRTMGSVAYAGEGFGLARAFLAAGARTVVATRWEVADRAAARMMESFYEGLRAGLARDEALARAGRAIEREGFPPRDRWGFLLLGVGDAPSPLPER